MKNKMLKKNKKGVGLRLIKKSKCSVDFHSKQEMFTVLSSSSKTFKLDVHHNWNENVELDRRYA